jgi:hypothetical protein
MKIAKDARDNLCVNFEINHVNIFYFKTIFPFLFENLTWPLHWDCDQGMKHAWESNPKPKKKVKEGFRICTRMYIIKPLQ